MDDSPKDSQEDLQLAPFAPTNELVDYVKPEWRVDTSAFDVLNSIFWPTVLFLVARRRRIHPPIGG